MGVGLGQRAHSAKARKVPLKCSPRAWTNQAHLSTIQSLSAAGAVCATGTAAARSGGFGLSCYLDKYYDSIATIHDRMLMSTTSISKQACGRSDWHDAPFCSF